MTENQTFSEEQYILLNTIESEFRKGMLALNSIGMPLVTVYGGTFVEKTSQTYQDIYQLCKEFGNNGWAVASGGGPGVMEAALLGAIDGQGKSVAFRINIENEVPTLEADINVAFTQFAPRKYALRQADAYVFAPGGLGTFDELFELLCLIKVNKIQPKHVFLYDSLFWNNMLDWVRGMVAKERGLLRGDFDHYFTVVDSVDEVINLIK